MDAWSFFQTPRNIQPQRGCPQPDAAWVPRVLRVSHRHQARHKGDNEGLGSMYGCLVNLLKIPKYPYSGLPRPDATLFHFAPGGVAGCHVVRHGTGEHRGLGLDVWMLINL
jgi:hypothetical protein